MEKAVISFTNVDAVSRVIKDMRFYPCLQFAHIIYLRFLNSSVANIAQNALLELREKARTTPDFSINGFESILVAYIKTVVKDPSKQPQLITALNILCELLLNGNCLSVAVGDNELIQSRLFGKLITKSQTIIKETKTYIQRAPAETLFQCKQHFVIMVTDKRLLTPYRFPRFVQ